MSYDLKTTSGKVYSWHVAAEKPQIGSKVSAIQADGHELIQLNSRLRGIPTKYYGIAYWEGDMAQWIYDNL